MLIITKQKRQELVQGKYYHLYKKCSLLKAINLNELEAKGKNNESLRRKENKEKIGTASKERKAMKPKMNYITCLHMLLIYHSYNDQMYDPSGLGVNGDTMTSLLLNIRYLEVNCVN